MSTVIDWDRLDRLENGGVINDVSANTCRLAELIEKGVKGSDNPTMELAMQLAIWREAYADVRTEFRPAAGGPRAAVGFSELQRLLAETDKQKQAPSAENDKLKMDNGMLRYTMQGVAEKLAKEAAGT
jgi:hypothetical protein